MTSYSLHHGARTVWAFSGLVPGALGLLFLLAAFQRPGISDEEVLLIAVGIPCLLAGAWTLYRTFTRRVEITPHALVVRGLFGTRRLSYDEIAGLAVYRMPISGYGFARITRKMVGGDTAIGVFVKPRRERTLGISVSMYESWQEIMKELQTRTQKEFVELDNSTRMAWIRSRD
jgi:hypothetical protein